MESNDETDIDKIIQDELDALTLDDPFDDIVDDNENDTKELEDEQVINETRRNLEHDMYERLAAFENEIKLNLNRYEIDYSEIDELLQKPIGQNEDDIQTNVAKECGIQREELDQILRSINAEELPLNSSIDSELTEREEEEEKHESIKESISTVDTDESAEPTPRIQEDPNKKLHDERLAESHRRMFDELALLDQRRKEEEERYAAVLQEQQARLAEEYRRLQETLDESARQTQNEKAQFETLCREQERLTTDRQNKMAIIIQSWYRGRHVYRKYHKEIIKRAAPTLKAIAKKRKKKEQEDLANAAKLTKIQEVNIIETENDRITHTNTILAPSNNRISSPSPNVINKQENKVETVPTIRSSKEDSTKKKTTKQSSTIVSKPTTSNSSLLTTQIVQLENPADFMPTIIPEPRKISTPRKVSIDNNNTADSRRISSPIQSIEQRPKSSNKRQLSAKTEPTQISVNTNNMLPTNESFSTSVIPIKSSIPVNTENPPIPIRRTDTFEKQIESPLSPLIEKRISTAKSTNRSETFDKESEFSSPRPPSIEKVSDTKPIERLSSRTIKRSDTFVGKSESSPLPPSSTDMNPTFVEGRSNTFVSTSERTSSVNEIIPVIKSIDTTPMNLPTSTTEQSVIIPMKSDIPLTPRVSTPRKPPVKEKSSNKITYSFLNEARRWAEHTRDINYPNLVLLTKEVIQQMPIRRTGGILKKLPDVDSQILKKAAKNRSSHEIQYLVLEQILTPCSLSLIGATYPNLTHLILRQCKLVQLVGLESCPSLTILDIEGNWLEQIHLQLDHLEYLNMSRNRVTSLLSINTPSLKYLNVSKNRLTRLNGIEIFSKLNILLATSNQLLTTIGLQGCTHLLHIDLSDNHLVEMEQLDQCPLLITIKATSNALIQIPNLFNAILLNELDLSSNSLTSFDELSVGSWLPLLTHLRLANNSLQELSTIKLPSLIEFDLGFNQLSDLSMLKRFIKACPLLSRINLEQNPVLCDITDPFINEEKSPTSSISLLPRSLTENSTESIELYLNFLSTITSIFITLRQTIEQCQTEPFQLIKSIHHQCQQYYEKKIIEPIELPEPILPEVNTKVLSPEEQNIIRLQSHWRRRLAERKLIRKRRAAKIIQAHWRGYAVRQRMRTVRRLYSQPQQQTFDEIDLTQFDFDENAFDVRFQRPRTPVTRVRHVWQPHHQVLSKTTTITDLPRPFSSRSSSAASSHAKPLIEPLAISDRTAAITNEWGFAPTSSTAALMLKRAEKMKWNAERKHKRDHMDAYQRLQMARQNEQPPGSLRLARRHPTLANTTKPIPQKKTLSPPSTSQSRPNRVFEWVHTQVAKFDDASSTNTTSPRYERKRLPSLDGSTDSMNRMRPNDILQQQQQQRWSSSTVSIRQPPPLLPPINGHLPRV